MTARLDRARAALEASGAMGLFATPSVNFAWLTDCALERSERLVGFGLPRSGDPWVVCPAFEVERLAAALPGARLAPWDESDDPFALAARLVAESGAGEWLVEPSTAWHDGARLAEALGNAAPAARLVDGAELFEGLRRPKDAAELAALGRAVGDAWGTFDAVVPGLARGVTEREVEAAFAAEMGRRGREPWSLIQFGPGSALPHGAAGDRPLAAGMAVLFDWGGWGEGFSADLTRSFWWDDGVVPLADAPDDYRAVVDLVQRAQRAAIERAAPGVECGALDQVAREAIAAAGHRARFTHRLGHGLGREIHEAPYLVAGSRVPLAVGDVVTVEPGVYIPGEWGVRWEDDVVVVEGGVENLSRREIEIGGTP